jgi:hypothetical protein
LVKKGMIARRRRPDGILGNYVTNAGALEPPSQAVESEGHQGVDQSAPVK